MTSQKLIAQCAEAKIYLQDNVIIKDRVSKSYRIKEIDDRIRRLRTRSEEKILKKLVPIINVPQTYENKDEHKIKMEYIQGEKIASVLNNLPLNKQKQIMKEIGIMVAKLHSANICHGDLTTSNMILMDEKGVINNKNPAKNVVRDSMANKYGVGGRGEGGGEIFFIDFGLSFQNARCEDKAVDIHLLKRALEAKHWQNWKVLYSEFEKSYKSVNKSEAEKVLNQLNKVEKRGRYKH